MEMYTQLLAAAKAASAELGPIVLKAIVRLGFLRKQIGDFAGAREAYDFALAQSERKGGTFHEETLQVAVNLALAYKAEGDYEREKAVYKKFLPDAGTISEPNAAQAKFFAAMRKRLWELELEEVELE